MLEVKLNSDILTVIEIRHLANETFRQYSYVNIKTWHTNGRIGKIDDTILDYKMCDASIDWCKKYYLPKVTEFQA